MIFVKDLSSGWSFSSACNQYKGQATIPGCNYTDLINNGIIDDPFVGENEKNLRWVAEKDWVYDKVFTITDDAFTADIIKISFDSIDTIADVYINDNKIASVNNAHMRYEFDIKEYIKKGSNSIKIYIHSPIAYITAKQKERALPRNFSGIDGFAYIRKPAYHYGWDWGPVLPCSGLEGSVKLIYGSGERVESIRHEQSFFDNKAEIIITAEISNAQASSKISCTLLSPSGDIVASSQAVPLSVSGDTMMFTSTIVIDNPELWYANGMTNKSVQPIYKLQVAAMENDEITHSKEVEIGLREIELSTQADAYGNDFCFIVNGNRIFAKGANWIPCDSFMSRVDKDTLERYIKDMAKSNFNMVRIWGGGFYGSDDFYSLCNKYGILVWQDFQYACAPYPFIDKDFLTLALTEAEQNIKRIRNHPSLCLLCGNNEIEAMSFGWFGVKDLITANGEFFYHALPKLINSLTSCIYWQGSPGSGTYMKKMASDNIGDTHIWSVWHGMQAFSYFLKRKTRFCSEYGFESFPSRDTLNAFITSEKDLALDASVMKAHQKCAAGNDRMLYYIVDKYRIPKDFFHLTYLTQLNQAESIATAAEFWRRNMGRCNGSLYWQLNDCWHTASWSSIEYNGKYKALQYYAKDFYQGVAVSVQADRKLSDIYVVNDTLSDFDGTISWRLVSFDGKTLASKNIDVGINAYSAKSIDKVVFNNYIDKKQYKNTALIIELTDQNGRVVSTNSSLIVKEKNANLQKPNFNISSISKDKDNKILITFSSDTYARRVMLDISDTISPFDKNYFDMEAGKSYTVVFENQENITENQVADSLKLISVGCIEPQYSKLQEQIIKIKIALIPINFANRIIYKFM